MENHELGLYKKKIQKIFFSDEVLRGIVMPTLENDDYGMSENWYGGTNLETYVNGNVEYNDLIGHCFDVPFIYAPVSDTRMCLCVETIVNSWKGQSIKDVVVVIYVVCHRDFIRLDNKTQFYYSKNYNLIGNRIDIAIDRIGQLINGNNDFGVGRLVPIPIQPMEIYYPNNDFYGKVLKYKCSDFSTDYKNRVDGK